VRFLYLIIAGHSCFVFWSLVRELMADPRSETFSRALINMILIVWFVVLGVQAGERKRGGH
jgi:hypothetical protein